MKTNSTIVRWHPAGLGRLSQRTEIPVRGGSFSEAAVAQASPSLGMLSGQVDAAGKSVGTDDYVITADEVASYRKFVPPGRAGALDALSKLFTPKNVSVDLPISYAPVTQEVSELYPDQAAYINELPPEHYVAAKAVYELYLRSYPSTQNPQPLARFVFDAKELRAALSMRQHVEALRAITNDFDDMHSRPKISGLIQTLQEHLSSVCCKDIAAKDPPEYATELPLKQGRVTLVTRGIPEHHRDREPAAPPDEVRRFLEVTPEPETSVIIKAETEEVQRKGYMRVGEITIQGHADQVMRKIDVTTLPGISEGVPTKLTVAIVRDDKVLECVAFELPDNPVVTKLNVFRV